MRAREGVQNIALPALLERVCAAPAYHLLEMINLQKHFHEALPFLQLATCKNSFVHFVLENKASWVDNYSFISPKKMHVKQMEKTEFSSCYG